MVSRLTEQHRYPLQYIDVSLLEPWEGINVRKTDRFTDIENLATNIYEIGVQSPLVVKPSGNKFKVISGQRRLLAATKAGLKEVPCIIRKDIKPIDAIIASFSENIYRLDMNDDDKADAAYHLLDKFGSVDEVAKRLGVTPTTVRKYLSYKKLPDEIKDKVRDGKMTSTVAREIYYKFQDNPELAKEIANEYADSPPEHKPDVYASIKQSISSDTVKEVRERAKTIGGAVKYKILLPKPTSDVVKDIAKANNQQEPIIISQIVENWIDDFKRGKARL